MQHHGTEGITALVLFAAPAIFLRLKKNTLSGSKRIKEHVGDQKPKISEDFEVSKGIMVRYNRDNYKRNTGQV